MDLVQGLEWDLGDALRWGKYKTPLLMIAQNVSYRFSYKMPSLISSRGSKLYFPKKER